MTQDVNLSGIVDPEARWIIDVLLNSVETPSAEVTALRADNQCLRDENNRLKGEQGASTLRPSVRAAARDHSLEKEQRRPTPPRPAIDTRVLLQIDHTGSLAALVFAAYLQGRTTPLGVVGPGGRDGQPGCRRFADLLCGGDGVWSYLRTFEGFGIDAGEAPSALLREPTVVPQRCALRVRSVAVPHGLMPAVAYRIDYGGASLVYSGDMSGCAHGCVDLGRGCDVLLHDPAVPVRDLRESHLHTKLGVTAGMARDAGCRTLVLMHIMPYPDGDLDDVVATVRETHHGAVVVADNVMTIPVSRDAASC